MLISKDLVAASATPLILSLLEEAPSYGYAIIKRVRELSGEQLQWTDGMLYPVLHRLEDSGYVESYWETPPTGRRRKYYRITPAGRQALAEQKSQWDAVDTTLRKLWESGADDSAPH